MEGGRSEDFIGNTRRVTAGSFAASKAHCAAKYIDCQHRRTRLPAIDTVRWTRSRSTLEPGIRRHGRDMAIWRAGRSSTVVQDQKLRRETLRGRQGRCFDDGRFGQFATIFTQHDWKRPRARPVKAKSDKAFGILRLAIVG